MDKPASVKELFSPLGARLHDFESKKYLKTQTYWEFEGEEYIISHVRLIETIGKLADGYDMTEVYREAQYYKARVVKTIDNLEPVEYETDEGIEELGGFKPSWEIKTTSTSDKRKAQLMERYSNELSTYLSTLNSIIESREPFVRKATIDNEHKEAVKPVQNTITLPENFTVKQLSKIFEPQLSPRQAALFLFYLRDTGILPPYSDSDLGRLAEAFFVRNQKNVTTNLTDIHAIKQSKDELLSLKRVLEKLVSEVESDLTKAR